MGTHWELMQTQWELGGNSVGTLWELGGNSVGTRWEYGAISYGLPTEQVLSWYEGDMKYVLN